MNCKAIGYDLKALQAELQPGETFYCEKSAIIYYEDGISANVKVLDKGIGGMIKRKMSGESIFHVELHNNAHVAKKLMVAGKMGILPLDLKQFSGGILCRSSYYVASTGPVDVDFKFDLSSLIGGMGAALQRLSGFCTVFLDSIGSPIPLNLSHGETIFVDERSLICVSAQVQMSSFFSGTNMLAGEGFSMLRMTGPGVVYVNSVNINPQP